MPSKAEKINAFDPNAAAVSHPSLFGLPFTPEESDVVAIPIPWDVTTSYHAGTHRGPQAILEGSLQVDLFSPSLPHGWQNGIAYSPVPGNWLEQNAHLRAKAEQWIEQLEAGASSAGDQQKSPILEEVNAAGEEMRKALKRHAKHWLEQGKIVGVIGGEHSVPLGLMEALADRHLGFGILQIDAHFDLRKAYEGFQYSHASIMYNALQHSGISKLVSLGIRDYCEEENQLAESDGRIQPFLDKTVRDALYNGQTWAAICAEIIAALPQQVYISFDIDGLLPYLCPNTGTPVPGGLEFSEISFLLEALVDSGREIIGFDLCEVAPGTGTASPNQQAWDGNVGARVLYALYLASIRSRK